MLFQDIINNVWSVTELNILRAHGNESNKDLSERFTIAGFNRSASAVAKKRAKLAPKKDITKEEIIVEKVIETPKPTIYFTSTPKGENIFYKECTAKMARTPGKTQTTLVVPDAHVKPNESLERFSKLGDMIIDRKPSNIVLMGDFVTLESLSAWDLGKAGKMEGKRYSEDTKAGIQAIDLMLSPLRRLQARQRKNKEELYEPRIVYIMGNHEDRLARYVSTKPELAEHLEMGKDLQLEDSGFTDVIPYRSFIEIEGVLFTHAVMNAANLAIGGKTALATIAQSVSKSVVIGHLHRLETVNITRHGADDITQIVSAGCFFEGVEDYADGGLNAYWRGVLLLNHYKPGRFDIESISIDRLMELY